MMSASASYVSRPSSVAGLLRHGRDQARPDRDTIIRLPGGTQVGPVFIPGGGSRIYVVGKPSTKIVTPPGYTGPVFVVGDDKINDLDTNANLEGWASRIAVSAGGVPDRDTELIDLAAETVVPAGYYWLVDDTLTAYDDPGQGDINRELVYVIGNETATQVRIGRLQDRKVGTGQGLGGTFSGSGAFLVPVYRATHILEIENVQLSGENAADDYLDRLMILRDVDHLVLNGVTCSNWTWAGILGIGCRYITMDGCDVDESDASIAGAGYAHYFVAGQEIEDRNFTMQNGGRHPCVTSYGFRSGKWQHDMALIDLYDEASAVNLEVGPHVSNGRDSLCHDVTMSGTARGIGFGGHTKFGTSEVSPVARDIEVNGGVAVVAMATSDVDARRITGMGVLSFAPAGDRTAWYANAVPVGPLTPNGSYWEDCDCERLVVNAGFQAGTYALLGHHHFVRMSVQSTIEGGGAVFLKSIGNDFAVTFEDLVVGDNSTGNRPVEIEVDNCEATIVSNGANITFNNGANTGRSPIRLKSLNGGGGTADITDTTHNREGEPAVETDGTGWDVEEQGTEDGGA